jgi:hypothetical protein
VLDQVLDFRDLAEGLFGKRGTRPADLFAWTPFELATLFTRHVGDIASAGLDRVAELHRVNHKVRAPKGLAPGVPSWLMPQVPRKTQVTHVPGLNEPPRRPRGLARQPSAPAAGPRRQVPDDA